MILSNHLNSLEQIPREAVEKLVCACRPLRRTWRGAVGEDRSSAEHRGRAVARVRSRPVLDEPSRSRSGQRQGPRARRASARRVGESPERRRSRTRTCRSSSRARACASSCTYPAASEPHRRLRPWRGRATLPTPWPPPAEGCGLVQVVQSARTAQVRTRCTLLRDFLAAVRHSHAQPELNDYARERRIRCG